MINKIDFPFFPFFFFLLQFRCDILSYKHERFVEKSYIKIYFFILEVSSFFKFS